MTWQQVQEEISNMLLSRGLKNPRIRLNALASLDRLFAQLMPEVRADPLNILKHDKKQVVERLSRGKDNGRLNSAEKSVLNNVYEVVGAGRADVASTSPAKTGVAENGQRSGYDVSQKLAALAEMLARLLEGQFGYKANYSFEVSPEWLLSVPNRELLASRWPDIAKIYNMLVDGRLDLDERLALVPVSRLRQKQKFDIWFSTPYNLALEFDEKQHFNQFRALTLGALPGYPDLPFDYDLYMRLANTRQAKPGTAGFTKLRSDDLLFPPLRKGEAQDNRTRQRAFRDLLKDVTPLCVPGVNQTIRISYATTHDKTKGFDETDVEAVRRHILQKDLLARIRLV